MRIYMFISLWRTVFYRLAILAFVEDVFPWPIGIRTFWESELGSGGPGGNILKNDTFWNHYSSLRLGPAMSCVTRIGEILNLKVETSKYC